VTHVENVRRGIKVSDLPDISDTIWLACVRAIAALHDGNQSAAVHYLKQARDLASVCDPWNCDIRDIVDLATDADFIDWGDE
jgi:hypothetical protein